MDRRKIYSNTYRSQKVFSERKKAANGRKRFGLFKKIVKLSLLIAILVAINILLSNDHLKIKNIKITGDLTFSNDIEEKTKKELDESRLLLYKNSNFILFNSTKLNKDILKEIKEIKYLNIKRKFPNTIEISVKEKKAKLGWETTDKKYLVDEDGYILKEINELKDVPIIKDASNLPVNNDKKVTYPNFIRFVEDLSGSLKNMKIDYDFIEIKETTFVANILTKEGFGLIFDSTINLNSQISKLEEALKQIGDQRKSLDYIDLTVKNKAIYKFK